MVLEIFSVSHGKASAYLPVIDLLRNYFRIAGKDDERTRREKVTGRVLALDRNLEDTLPYLFSLLGIVEGDDPLNMPPTQSVQRRFYCWSTTVANTHISGIARLTTPNYDSSR
jgi:hypothetical protein